MKVRSNPTPHEPPFFLWDAAQLVEPVAVFLKLHWARGMSATTIRAYAYDLLAFYRFLREQHLCLHRLTTQQLIDFILAHRKQHAAPRTINRRLTVVRAFLNAQYDQLGDQLLGPLTAPAFYKGARNRALVGKSRLKREMRRAWSVKVPTVLITPLTPTEITKFLTGVRTYRDLAIIYLMLFCGLRSCEILSLETTAIDFIDNQLLIRGKGSKERLMPMPPSVRKALRWYLDYERPTSAHHRCFVVLKGVSRGLPLTAAGLRRLFRYRRQLTQLKKANPHRFRHTFCTNLITQGVSLPVVQKLMGHADIDITMAYVHLSPSDVAKEYHRAMNSLEAHYDTEKTS